jgi:hypothetical protein
LRGGSAAVKVTLDQRVHPGSDDPVELATLRYKAAYAQYRGLVDKNAEVSMTGTKPSEGALLDEERAFDELDSARYALFNAAAVAFPTVH